MRSNMPVYFILISLGIWVRIWNTKITNIIHTSLDDKICLYRKFILKDDKKLISQCRSLLSRLLGENYFSLLRLMWLDSVFYYLFYLETICHSRNSYYFTSGSIPNPVFCGCFKCWNSSLSSLIKLMLMFFKSLPVSKTSERKVQNVNKYWKF